MPSALQPDMMVVNANRGAAVDTKMLGPVLNERGLRYRRNILLVSAALILIGVIEGIDASGFAPLGLAIGNHIWWIGPFALVYQLAIYRVEISASFHVWRLGLVFRDINQNEAKQPSTTSMQSPLLLLGWPGPKWIRPPSPDETEEVEWWLLESPAGFYEHQLFYYSGRRFKYLSESDAEPIIGVSRTRVSREAFINARRRFLEFVLVDIGLVALMAAAAIIVSLGALLST